jgi:Tfp pilus assembly protein PilX
MQNTSLEERMAGNLRAERMAFEAAEQALRAGEWWLRFADPANGINRRERPDVKNTLPDPDNGEVWRLDKPYWGTTPPTAPWWTQVGASWWWDPDDPAQGNNSVAGPAFGEADSGGSGYVIEHLGRYSVAADEINITKQQPLADFFQVTARGVAPGGRGEVLLRSTYAGYYAEKIP